MNETSDVSEEEVLCLCEWLSKNEIIAAIPYARDLKDLKEQTGVCSTCFGCEGDLDELLDEHGHLFGTGLAG